MCVDKLSMAMWVLGWARERAAFVWGGGRRRRKSQSVCTDLEWWKTNTHTHTRKQAKKEQKEEMGDWRDKRKMIKKIIFLNDDQVKASVVLGGKITKESRTHIRSQVFALNLSINRTWTHTHTHTYLRRDEESDDGFDRQSGFRQWKKERRKKRIQMSTGEFISWVKRRKKEHKSRIQFPINLKVVSRQIH